MVRALLEGCKTQTRRIFVPPLPFDRDDDISVQIATGSITSKFAPGDRLYVREAHWFTDEGDCVPVAGNEAASEDEKKRPSIHMPRWASRLTLAITDVRVQRLQEISEADAAAEGCEAEWIGMASMYGLGSGPRFPESAKDQFRTLWNSLHGADAWDANPWVVALTFTVHRCNIDNMDTGGNGDD
jgi:hypothetical protein